MSGEDPSVTRFREYLRYPSVHPNPDYSGSIEWIKKQSNEIGLIYNFVEFDPPGEFAIWLTWEGKDPSLQTILLNSHIDVVPVDASKWTRDPFGAEKDIHGNIYARGAQDMKCVGIQYLEAIRKLKNQGFQPLRTVHISFVPDEEVGGVKGMAYFVKSQQFAKLNVGFGLDEGIASPDDTFNIYYGERTLWQIRVTALGSTGHASLLHENTAAEKIQYVINALLKIRTEQKEILHSKPNCELGDVTSINMTMLSGGLQPNVVPPELNAVFDMRITPQWDLTKWRKQLDRICEEAGKGVSYVSVRSSYADAVESTRIDSSNVWWIALKKATDSLGLNIHAKIFPARTDAKFLRQIGIPAFGFSPMNNTPILLHDHDEFLNEDVFLKGIKVYEEILKNITSVN